MMRNTVAFTFMRANPPTVGHMKLLQKLSEVDADGGRRVYLSHSQDNMKNPLSYEFKLRVMRECVKENFTNIRVVDSKAHSFPLVLEDLCAEGFRNVVIVVGGDRVEEFQIISDKYNGKPDKSGRILYSFDSIEVVSAGERDPDSSDVSGMSATKLRQAAVDGDFESFLAGVATGNRELAEEVYDEVRANLKPHRVREANDLVPYQGNATPQATQQADQQTTQNFDPRFGDPNKATDAEFESIISEEGTKANKEAETALATLDQIGRQLETLNKAALPGPGGSIKILFLVADPFTKDHESVYREFRKAIGPNDVYKVNFINLPNADPKEILVQEGRLRKAIASFLLNTLDNSFMSLTIPESLNYFSSLQDKAKAKGINLGVDRIKVEYLIDPSLAKKKTLTDAIARFSDKLDIQPLQLNLSVKTWDTPNKAKMAFVLGKNPEITQAMKSLKQEMQSAAMKESYDRKMRILRHITEIDSSGLSEETKTGAPTYKERVASELKNSIQKEFIKNLPGNNEPAKVAVFQVYYSLFIKSGLMLDFGAAIQKILDWFKPEQEALTDLSNELFGKKGTELIGKSAKGIAKGVGAAISNKAPEDQQLANRVRQTLASVQ